MARERPVMLEIPLGAKFVKHYPYRQAQVYDHVMVVDCFADSVVVSQTYSRFHRECAYLAHTEPDNHEVYAFQSHNGKMFYYMFSDWKLYIGLTLVERKP